MELASLLSYCVGLCRTNVELDKRKKVLEVEYTGKN